MASITTTTASVTRELFGGAIKADIPVSFLDISPLVPVPDNQEVFQVIALPKSTFPSSSTSSSTSTSSPSSSSSGFLYNAVDYSTLIIEIVEHTPDSTVLGDVDACAAFARLQSSTSSSSSSSSSLSSSSRAGAYYFHELAETNEAAQEGYFRIDSITEVQVPACIRTAIGGSSGSSSSSQGNESPASSSSSMMLVNNNGNIKGPAIVGLKIIGEQAIARPLPSGGGGGGGGGRKAVHIEMLVLQLPSVGTDILITLSVPLVREFRPTVSTTSTLPPPVMDTGDGTGVVSRSGSNSSIANDEASIIASSDAIITDVLRTFKIEDWGLFG